MNESGIGARDSMFWRDDALPFIEARSVQDGRKVCYARHWHETFSIGVISRGQCTYINRTHKQRVAAGTVVLMNPGDVHACNPIHDEPWAYQMLFIDVPWLQATQEAEDTHHRARFMPFSVTSTRQLDLYHGLNRLFETLVDPQVDHLDKETVAVSYLSLVRRSLDFERSRQPDSYPSIARAAAYIRENCTQQIRLRDVCAETNLSASHLIRAFKRVHRMTPHAYQINCRIEFCRVQLRAGRPIAEVAHAAGFSDQAHLQRTFKSIVAATPGEYRA